MHPDKRCKEQGPEPLGDLGGAVQHRKVAAPVVGLEGEPAETLIYIVGVDGIECLGVQFPGVLEHLGGGAGFHGALDGMPRLALHKAKLEHLEPLPQTLGLAFFQAFSRLEKGRRVAQVIVHTNPHNAFDDAACPFVLCLEGLCRVQGCLVVQCHGLGRCFLYQVLQGVGQGKAQAFGKAKCRKQERYGEGAQ